MDDEATYFKEFLENFSSKKLPRDLEPLHNESKREYGRRFLSNMKEYTTKEQYTDAELIGLAWYNYNHHHKIQGGEKERGCKHQTQSKYRNRPSPSYPANECCGYKKIGNDGELYESSRSGKQRSCTWKKISRSVSRSTTSKNSELERMTIPELTALCRKRKIKNYSGLNKAQLVAHIKRFI